MVTKSSQVDKRNLQFLGNSSNFDVGLKEIYAAHIFLTYLVEVIPMNMENVQTV